MEVKGNIFKFIWASYVIEQSFWAFLFFRVDAFLVQRESYSSKPKTRRPNLYYFLQDTFQKSEFS